MQAENPRLKAGLVKARLAEEMEARQDFKRSLELYKEAVAILIPLINGKFVGKKACIVKFKHLYWSHSEWHAHCFTFKGKEQGCQPTPFLQCLWTD